MSEPTRFCTHCGAPLTPQMRFCGACGRPVNGPAKRRGWLITLLVIGGVILLLCVCAGVGLVAWNYSPGGQAGFWPDGLRFPEVLNPARATQIAALSVTPTEISTPTPVPPTATPTPIPLSVVNFNGVHFVYDPRLAADAVPEVVLAKSSSEVPPWEVAPQHYAFNFAGYPLTDTLQKPRILVYPLADLAQVNSYVSKNVDDLKTMLITWPELSEKDSLPFVPTWNASQIFHAQVKYIDGTGVRYLTQYSQAIDPLNNEELFYTYQGISADGKYYIVAILPVASIILPDHRDLTSAEYMASEQKYAQYLRDITEKLNKAPADSFTPNLDLLDALVQSIVVK